MSKNNDNASSSPPLRWLPFTGLELKPGDLLTGNNHRHGIMRGDVLWLVLWVGEANPGSYTRSLTILDAEGSVFDTQGVSKEWCHPWRRLV